MRQQLVTWLIDDIAPDIRKNRDPEGTILKFANERNLEPALVQGLGQLFNTAKTLSFMEKSSKDRGATFPLLDVPAMVDKYLDVRPNVKSARRRRVEGEPSTYDQLFDATNSSELASYFDNIPGLKVEPETTYTETKVASVREELRSDSEYKYNVEILNQAVSDFEQDARELLTKMAQHIKQHEIDFEKLEQDALWVHGDSIKPATELLASYCKSTHVKVARAKDAGENRLVRDNMDTIANLLTVNELLYKRAVASDMLDEVKAEQGRRSSHRGEKLVTGEPVPVDTGGGAPPKSNRPSLPQGENGGRKSNSPAPNRAENKRPEKGTGGFVSNVTKAHGVASNFLGSGFNSGQQQVDNAHEEAKHIAVLQNLLTTDDVLAEADPEQVVNMYNTIRRVSPSMAGDSNIMRVALRSMIQHDGISPFDVKGFLEAEQAHQKTDYNKRLLDELDYGGADFAPEPRPTPQ